MPISAEIIEGCKKGKETAMKAFYEHFHAYALAICLAYSEDRNDALEMMNDGFLKAFKNLHKLENFDYLKPWIRKIMVNIAIDFYRKNNKWKTTELIDNQLVTNENNDDVFAKISAEEILKAVQNLPKLNKIVFNLFVLEGFNHKEIAEKLSISEGSSRAYLSLANSQLRQVLSKNFPEYVR